MRGTTMASFLAFLLLPAVVRGQEPVRSFDHLTAIKAGDTVRVTGKDGRRTKGTVGDLDTISLLVDGVRFQAADIVSIEKRVHPLGRSIGIGAGVGVAVGLLGYADCSKTDAWGCALTVPMLTGIGAGVGALIGRLGPGRMRPVYRAPAGEARLSIAPVVTARTRAVVLSVSF